MKKIIIALMFLLATFGIADSYENENVRNGSYSKIPFTSDGELHEEKLLNRIFSADDTEIMIKKLKNGKYQFIDYSDDTSSENPEENQSPQITEAVRRKNAICDEYVCIGYDVILKTVVFLDTDTFRVIYPTGEKMYDPSFLELFPEENPKLYKLYRDHYKLYKK